MMLPNFPGPHRLEDKTHKAIAYVLSDRMTNQSVYTIVILLAYIWLESQNKKYNPLCKILEINYNSKLIWKDCNKI